MKKDPNIYLLHIQDAITTIKSYTNGMSYGEFVEDGKTNDAVFRQMTIIGEASNKFGKVNQQKIPSVPWAKIIALRNVIIHDYENIASQRIWEIIQNDLAPLDNAIAEFLGKEQ